MALDGRDEHEHEHEHDPLMGLKGLEDYLGATWKHAQCTNTAPCTNNTAPCTNTDGAVPTEQIGRASCRERV